PSSTNRKIDFIPLRLYSLPCSVTGDETWSGVTHRSHRGLYTAAMPADTDLLAPLQRYWGYDSFRPLQERVVRSLLGGRDTCVVMRTGGGKSLCYQLPALVLGQTAVVISPLIALMQDQAAQLAQMQTPAAVLNSTLPA